MKYFPYKQEKDTDSSKCYFPILFTDKMTQFIDIVRKSDIKKTKSEGGVRDM